MKFTPRDKKLLIALGIIIFLAVLFKFLFLPKLTNISTLKTDIDTLNSTYATNMAYKAKSENIDSDIKILSKKLVDLRAIYPPSINCDELLIIMRDLTNASKLDITSMTFDGSKPTNLLALENTDAKATTTTPAPDAAVASVVGNQALAQPQVDINALNNGSTADIMNYFYLWGLKSLQDPSSTEAVVIPDGKGYSASVKIDAQGTNEQVKSFLTSLSKLANRAYCKNASIVELSNGQSDAAKQMLKFTAEIEFYGIMDKGAGEYYLLPNGKWMPVAAAGKSNLFEPYSGYTASSSSNSESATNLIPKQNENTANNVELGNYDFSMVASAFGGGLAPSVSVACKNPESNVTYANPVVYGDNKGIENTELFIEEKAGKYYCKFKTDHESYPDKQYKETFEFVPVGKDLRLVILSSQRSGEEDKAGVNFNIINNTNKNLKYEIKYEDAKAPRVKIGKTVGSVSINNG
ncbi:MAG TPA: hypothetical protein VIK78_01420 [Ruminiclostridium sp.]